MNPIMKCQYCEKPATFHITELTGDSGPQILHLCEEHARKFLQKGSNESSIASVTGAIAKQLNLGATKEDLAKMDQNECPHCGITFFEFRNTGRLGCPYDYEHFADQLEPLLVNIHDATTHIGKKPQRASVLAESKQNLLTLRREMDDAVANEDYERASQIRDRMREMENALSAPKNTPPAKIDGGSESQESQS
jgi:protein arginine kinase activator